MLLMISFTSFIAKTIRKREHILTMANVGGMPGNKTLQGLFKGNLAPQGEKMFLLLHR
jgi:hypothetical protein